MARQMPPTLTAVEPPGPPLTTGMEHLATPTPSCHPTPPHPLCDPFIELDPRRVAQQLRGLRVVAAVAALVVMETCRVAAVLPRVGPAVLLPSPPPPTRPRRTRPPLKAPAVPVVVTAGGMLVMVRHPPDHPTAPTGALAPVVVTAGKSSPSTVSLLLLGQAPHPVTMHLAATLLLQLLGALHVAPAVAHRGGDRRRPRLPPPCVLPCHPWRPCAW